MEKLMPALSIEVTARPPPVAVGLRIARAILGLMVLRAGTVEAFAEPQPGESGAGFHVAVDGQAHHAGTADSPWDIESALAGAHAIPPGSTVYLKGGTYRHPDRRWESPGFAIALAGAPGRPVHIRPVPGHRVTLDGKVEVSINRFKQVTESGNTVLPPGSRRPDRPADIILRPSRYVPGRGNLAIFNWARRSQVDVDLSTLLKPGQPFTIVNALDFYGEPLVAGRFDGHPVPVPMPNEPRTGNGEFCAFVVLPGVADSGPATQQPTSTAR